MPRPRVNLTEFFWNRVDKGDDDECWPWTGGKQSRGYGSVDCAGNQRISAHRLSFVLHHGPIPPGKIVCHTCNNPPCVNPKHLYAGTHAENTRDITVSGRDGGRFEHGSKHPNAKLDNQNILTVFQMRQSGYYQKEIAELFGVDQSQISRILNKKAWIKESEVLQCAG